MFWVLVAICVLLALILAELLWLDHLFRNAFALPILSWIKKKQVDRAIGDDDMFENVKTIELHLRRISDSLIDRGPHDLSNR